MGDHWDGEVQAIGWGQASVRMAIVRGRCSISAAKTCYGAEMQLICHPWLTQFFFFFASCWTGQESISAKQFKEVQGSSSRPTFLPAPPRVSPASISEDIQKDDAGVWLPFVFWERAYHRCQRAIMTGPLTCVSTCKSWRLMSSVFLHSSPLSNLEIGLIQNTEPMTD